MNTVMPLGKLVVAEKESDGFIDSICLNCLLTIASSYDEQELAAMRVEGCSRECHFVPRKVGGTYNNLTKNGTKKDFELISF